METEFHQPYAIGLRKIFIVTEDLAGFPGVEIPEGSAHGVPIRDEHRMLSLMRMIFITIDRRNPSETTASRPSGSILDPGQEKAFGNGLHMIMIIIKINRH
jgi:hypothetical protein